jgi:hypothetical protein
MAKRSKRRRREPPETVSYTDPEGNVLDLRVSLSAGTIASIRKGPKRAGASAEDIWQRRNEFLFERLAVNWEIAGLPLDDQKMLLGSYRMADDETRRWVARTIDAHLEQHIPELSGG